MSDDPLRLDRIQRWMQAVITHPDGVEAGIESDDARGLIDIPCEQVEQMIGPSQRRTSVERLEVYANAYFARLLECLRDEFPALVHALGEEVFDGFTFGYLQAYPSTSYTLSDLSAKFPAYLEETRPDDIDEGGGPAWPDFLIDLARLERTYGEVFDGPGPERSELLKAEQILAVGPEKWADARLVPVPWLRLLTFRYPVHEYATAVRLKEEATIPEPEATRLAISRIDFRVRRWTLSPVQFELLEALCAGEPVGRAIERAAQAVSSAEELDRLAASLRDWFEEWAAAGFFLAIEVPQ